jgi:hypothetical protein
VATVALVVHAWEVRREVNARSFRRFDEPVRPPVGLSASPPGGGSFSS